MQPHPDYFTLGPSLQFFANNGVKGVFEEGDYSSNGGDMAELKAWVIAQMLWDPKQDPKKLIDEFLQGYYGPGWHYVHDYLNLMASAARSVNLSFALPASTPFLTPEVFDKAVEDWGSAIVAVADLRDRPELLWRAWQSYASVEYVLLNRWVEYSKALLPSNRWPFSLSRKMTADEWLGMIQGGPVGYQRKTAIGWTPVTAVNESGLSPKQFVANLGADPPDPLRCALARHDLSGEDTR